MDAYKQVECPHRLLSFKICAKEKQIKIGTLDENQYAMHGVSKIFVIRKRYTCSGQIVM